MFPNWNSTAEATTSYVYTYHVASAKFSGPSFDNSGNINVVGCSGLQGVNYCGSGD